MDMSVFSFITVSKKNFFKGKCCPIRLNIRVRNFNINAWTIYFFNTNLFYDKRLRYALFRTHRFGKCFFFHMQIVKLCYFISKKYIKYMRQTYWQFFEQNHLIFFNDKCIKSLQITQKVKNAYFVRMAAQIFPLMLYIFTILILYLHFERIDN